MNLPWLIFAVLVLVVCFQTPAFATVDTPPKKANSTNDKTDKKPPISSAHLRQTYVQYCTHCHGTDGRPTSLIEKVTPEIPDFSLIDWSDYGTSDVIASIADGTGQMPGFKNVLTELEMKSLALMIQKFPKGKPFSLIEKRSRFRKADGKLLEKAQELEDQLRSLLD